MKLEPRRLLVWILALGVLLAIAIAFRPRPVAVDLAAATRGPLEVTVDEEGETRVRERFVVSAPLAGKVLRIELEPGDPVAAGETMLATFEPRVPDLLDTRARAEIEARVKAARAALGRARAERQAAEAELAHARSELERSRNLAAQEILSRERLEAAELLVTTREEGLRAATHALRGAEYELEVQKARLAGEGAGAAKEPIELRSPIDGVVLRRLRESEAVVAAGEPLLEVGDPAELEIVADLLSVDAVKVASGDPVVIGEWGGEAPLHGRVRRVEPSGFTKVSALGVEEQRVNVLVDLEDPHAAWEALGDGYRVEVKIVVWRSEDVLRVPVSSLLRRGEEWAVFVLDGGRARLRTVGLGHRGGLEAEVLSGLAAGEQVIIHPPDTVEDGTQAEARTT